MLVPSLRLGSSVHPRIREERCRDRLKNSSCCGSSPHTRGTQHRLKRFIFDLRFIPAYAGNASLSGERDRGRPVHPRIRGERSAWTVRPGRDSGSSPHTRGTPRQVLHLLIGTRFIPAYAGNAPAERFWLARPSVHPRIRGERHTPHFPRSCIGGSSPHTRGTLLISSQAISDSRFIPAYAGNARLNSRKP